MLGTCMNELTSMLTIFVCLLNDFGYLMGESSDFFATCALNKYSTLSTLLVLFIKIH